MKINESLDRPSWAGIGKLEAYKHKHVKGGVLWNYYVKRKGMV
jgi:hypothetical protein